jgi:hypothetical protein
MDYIGIHDLVNHVEVAFADRLLVEAAKSLTVVGHRRRALASRAQCRRPPSDLVEHGGCRRVAATGIVRFAGGLVEQRPNVVKADRVAHRHRVQLGEHLPQLLDRAKTAGHAPVGHEADRLGPPLRIGDVDRLLETCGVAVVVLRRDDHEGVGTIEAGDVLPHRRGSLGGQLCRQVDVEQVDNVDEHVVAELGLSHEPAPDDVAEAPFASAPDDDGQMKGVVRDHAGDRKS